MLREQLFARGSPPGFQVGQVLVQDANQFLAGDAWLVGCRNIGRLGGSFGPLRLRLVGIGHGLCSLWRGSRTRNLGYQGQRQRLPRIIGPEAPGMSRTDSATSKKLYHPLREILCRGVH